MQKRKPNQFFRIRASEFPVDLMREIASLVQRTHSIQVIALKYGITPEQVRSICYIVRKRSFR